MRHVTVVPWASAPHLTEEQKTKILASIPPHLRLARTEGVPYLGAGAIYSAHVTVESISVSPFAIPDHWKRAYGLDVGWNKTAAVWAAWDQESDIVYCYSEHYMGQIEPIIHASAIKGQSVMTAGKWGVHRASWIPGVIDPASKGRSQIDGRKLVDQYKGLGLDLEYADNAVEAGIVEVWSRLSSGRLKFFDTLTNLFTEYRLYRRDKNGKVVKDNDHLMDALRYLLMSGLERARPVPVETTVVGRSYSMSPNSWLGA